MPQRPAQVTLPADLRPADGRFGSGPSKVRPEAVAALGKVATTWLGTSHRQAPVRDVVGRIRAGLAELFELPDAYEVVLANGGSSMFWDLATVSLIERRSQHLVFGEFSAKFAAAAAAAPHLEEPDVLRAPYGSAPQPRPEASVDAYALTHNETSTGVCAPVQRPAGSDGDAGGALVLVDATSAAGAIRVDPGAFDAYYFAPQKVFGADGGLWLALLSPAAVERAERLAASGRWIPASLSLTTALARSRANETENTPALVTLFLILQQLEWIAAQGGLAWSAKRCEENAAVVYGWAERTAYARPFVTDPQLRSPTVATVDLEPPVDAAAVTATLRANGIVDIEPYRKLGRNQLRIGMYPAVEPADLVTLTRAIDHVVEALHP